MAITLGQIAQKQLSEARFHVVKHLFETGDHDQVLILGYSSSDVFDLTPQIQSLEGHRKRVIYLEHSTEESRVESLAARDWKNPFLRFEDGLRVHANTDELIEKLWTVFEPHEAYELRHHATSWMGHIGEWHGTLERTQGEAASAEVAARLFLMISDYPKAKKYHQRGLSAARAAGDQHGEVSHLMGLGIAHKSQGNFHQARVLFDQALPIARETGHRSNEGALLGNLANVYSDRFARCRLPRAACLADLRPSRRRSR